MFDWNRKCIYIYMNPHGFSSQLILRCQNDVFGGSVLTHPIGLSYTRDLLAIFKRTNCRNKQKHIKNTTWICLISSFFHPTSPKQGHLPPVQKPSWRSIPIPLANINPTGQNTLQNHQNLSAFGHGSFFHICFGRNVVSPSNLLILPIHHSKKMKKKPTVGMQSVDVEIDVHRPGWLALPCSGGGGPDPRVKKAEEVSQATETTMRFPFHCVSQRFSQGAGDYWPTFTRNFKPNVGKIFHTWSIWVKTACPPQKTNKNTYRTERESQKIIDSKVPLGGEHHQLGLGFLVGLPKAPPMPQPQGNSK